MNAVSVDELVLYFQSKISKLEIAASVVSGANEEEYTELFESLKDEMRELDGYLKLLRKGMDQQRQQLENLQHLKKQTDLMVEHLHYALNNVPVTLPSRPREPKVSNVQNSNSSQEKEKSQPTPGQTSIVTCQYLQFITVDDYESIPKYMKGRITYDKINSVIKHLDDVFVEKYRILKLKRSSLNDVNRKRFEAFKRQENKKTKGHSFIVEQDVSDLSVLKMDNTTRNILTILRHFNLIHEIRGDGFVRFAANAGYCYSY